MGGFGPDTGALTLLSQENLSLVLNKIPGKKQLILEPGLMRALDRVAKMSVLTKAGVENVYKFDRKTCPALPTTQTRTYLVSANLIQAKLIADQISESMNPGKTHIILLPRSMIFIDRLFEEEGLAGHVVLHSYCWEFIPLDDDLLSLELPSFFRSHYVSGDHSGLSTVARALWGMQSLYGSIPNIFAQGKSVKQLFKLMELFTQHYGVPKTKGQSEIGHLFVFERDLDWASCLLSPLTYEGLLDETFGISCGTVEFGPEVTKSESATTKLQLSSMDKMFDKIRNKHFASIFSVLGVTAKQLSAAQAAATTMNVTQMKQFVANDLKVMKTQSKAVALHIGASEVIQREKGSYFESQLPVEHALITGTSPRESISYIEDCMAQLRPLTIPLRLICLLSFCGDGLSQPDYQRLKAQFLQAYGFPHLVTWNNLVKLGLLRMKGGLSQSTSSSNLSQEAGKLGLMGQTVAMGLGLAKTSGNFQQVVKKLGLVPPELRNLAEPTNPGYVFNGAYIPLCCRLVEEILKLGPRSVSLTPGTPLAEAVKLLPGDTVHNFTQSDTTNKSTLILFLGGYTLAEVAAFRWLQTVTGHQFLLAGTNNINGNTLVSDVERL